MKIVFFGSDDFARAHLESLLESGFEVVCCVTQPDRSKDRGMKLSISPIKECAQEEGISIIQPESFDEAIVAALKDFEADLFVVISYGKILPQEIIDIPKICAINVHPSILPKYRGAAPINWAIINGDKKTGVSIIKLNLKMDAGDIVSCEEVDIADEDTASTLRVKTMMIGSGLLKETIGMLENDTCQYMAQEQKSVTLAPKLTKELGLIDWSQSAVIINNKVRGLSPWPSAYTYYEGKLFKILDSEVVDNKQDRSFGEVIEASKSGILVQTKENSLLLKQVQLQGSKEMPAHSFCIGHKIEVGFKFSNL
ncbi:MAG: methionyl-tRNA formyltransferase [Candidatus Zapsychrus exili]|nr:methionyl-tRNA formyltransferase [Candidatus Zapsychrus exili]